jgi:hypothetical protein
MFSLLFLLSCFMYWTAEAALPGQACSNTNPCTNSICCNGYCSACCDKLNCPKGDYCIVQNPPPSAGLKYQSCFPGDKFVNFIAEKNFLEIISYLGRDYDKLEREETLQLLKI